MYKNPGRVQLAHSITSDNINLYHIYHYAMYNNVIKTLNGGITMDIKMYGTTWCGDCKRAKAFFELHHVEYDWFDTDLDKESEDYVKSLNNGNRVVPTIIFKDGSMLVEPSDKELADQLGI